jgi:hypothetical protein
MAHVDAPEITCPEFCRKMARFRVVHMFGNMISCRYQRINEEEIDIS